MVNDEFNVTSSQDELQKLKLAEEERLEKIEQIRDREQQRKIRTMLNDRDHQVGLRKDENARKEENYLNEELRKIKYELQMNLKPKGVPGLSVEELKKHITKQVRLGYGKDLDKELRDYEAKYNKVIDRTISKVLNKQQEQTFEKRVERDRSASSDFASNRGETYREGHTKSVRIKPRKP